MADLTAARGTARSFALPRINVVMVLYLLFL
ncbi:MAG: sugar ABC transporter permease, partial [Roseovarius sp.]|nr:sugar ABC transporter permease [Roseovarius sp.]